MNILPSGGHYKQYLNNINNTRTWGPKVFITSVQRGKVVSTHFIRVSHTFYVTFTLYTKVPKSKNEGKVRVLDERDSTKSGFGYGRNTLPIHVSPSTLWMKVFLTTFLTPTNWPPNSTLSLNWTDDSTLTLTSVKMDPRVSELLLYPTLKTRCVHSLVQTSVHWPGSTV